MNQNTAVVACLFFALAAECAADRVYRIVGDPELQEGHTLVGSITTTDDAAEDGLLATEEVLGWRWTVTGPRTDGLPFVATHEDFPDDETNFSGIEITSDAIRLPLSTGGSEQGPELLLSTSMQVGRGGVDSNWLSWRVLSGDDSDRLFYSSGERDGDAIGVFWIKDVTGFDQASLLVASRVMLRDTNGDGVFNTLDIDPFVTALVEPEVYEATYGVPVAAVADVNADGVVNTLDIDCFIRPFLFGDPPIIPDPSCVLTAHASMTPATASPEPAALGLLSIAALAGALRRRGPRCVFSRRSA